MTKLYFYGCDLIWKTVKLDWDTLGKNIIKAGTPIDENGNIANDAHCIGLVMEDVTPSNKYARAVYRGETKFDVLEANCGIALSPEVMDVLDVYEHGKGGATSWNDLPDRPFGSEAGEVVVIPEQTLSVEVGEGFFETIIDFVGMSENENYIVDLDGDKYTCEVRFFNGEAYLGNGGVAFDGGEDTGEPFCVYDVPSSSLDENDASVVVSEGGEHTISVAKIVETITPLDTKYLPVMTVTLQRVSGENTFTSDKTYDEIMACLDRGYEVICMYKTSSGATPERAYLRLYLDGAIHFVRFSLIADLETGIVETFTITNMVMTADGTNYWAQSAISIPAES